MGPGLSATAKHRTEMTRAIGPWSTCSQWLLEAKLPRALIASRTATTQIPPWYSDVGRVSGTRGPARYRVDQVEADQPSKAKSSESTQLASSPVGLREGRGRPSPGGLGEDGQVG